MSQEPVFMEEMTLRDFFAGQALAGVIGGIDKEQAAEEAYAYADAMLRERAK